MKATVIIVFLVSLYSLAAVNARRGGFKRKDSYSPINQLIKSSLEENEHVQNTLKVLGLNLQTADGGSRSSQELCSLIEQSDPTIINLQQVRITEILSLKACFRKLSKSCIRPKRRTRGAKRKLSRRHVRRNCGYELVGAGSSNNEEATLFTPVIFKQKRNIRTTGNNGTFWLSESPEIAFTKLEEASTFRIATWMHLKVAVYQKRERTQQSAFERLLNALKGSKSGKKKGERKNGRPTTKWIDLYIVNTQLDSEDASIAKNQLNILLDYLKQKNLGNSEQNSIILSAGIESSFSNDLANILENRGYRDAIKDTRASGDDDTSKIPKSTVIWSKGLENIVTMGVESKHPQTAVLSALSYQ